MKKYITAAIFCLLSFCALAQQQEYKATVWGVKSDGVTDNTGTIQRAIDTISERGGGTLVFYVGRYLTGAVQLKDNVTIRLEEAAVLVGTTNYYGYRGAPALIWADGAKNVAVTGKGVIEMRGKALGKFVDEQKAKGYIGSEVTLPVPCKFANCTDAVLSEDIKILADTAASTNYSR